MDFRTQDNRQNQAAGQPAANSSMPAHRGGKSAKMFMGWRVASIALLFSVTVLIVALVLYVVFGSPNNENKYVDSTKVQAVFLNGGQVYFGKIRSMDQKYVRLSDIYYLSVNQQVQPDQKGQAAQQNISLVKLGCELHRPQDSMVINREQVIFWENLKDEAGENTVPGAIKKYIAANPNGQKCAEPQASTDTDKKP